jgi:hypothetical protein
MSDLFNNNSPSSPSGLGLLAFQDGTQPEGSSGRIFEFDTVGSSTDFADYFTFPVHNLDSITVEFDAGYVGNYAHALAAIPLSGVSKVTGPVIATWFGGIYENPDSPIYQDANHYARGQLYAVNAINNVIDIDYSGATLATNANEVISPKAVWTLTGDPVLVYIYGGSGFDSSDVSYSFTIRPKDGNLGEEDPTNANRFENDPNIQEIFQGTTDLDTYVAGGQFSNFSHEKSLLGEDHMVWNSAEAELFDTLKDIERIEYSDGFLALDIDGVAGKAYRLYQAAFDRTPDVEGLGFWIKQADGGSLDFNQIASYFMDSPEFSSKYGSPSTVSDQSFLTLLYNNVLDRIPDQAGFDFWANQQSKGLEREEMITYFSESVENVTNVAQTIDDGIWYV